MNGAVKPPPSRLKDMIDANSGRFEFLKQTLTLGLAGIGGVAALFTDPSRIPSETLPRWLLICAGAGLLFVVAFAIMGLSAYANLLTVTAKVPSDETEVAKYSKGVRNHARVVIIALFVALIGTATFALDRLFASSATPESAVTAAADFVAKETKLTTDRLHFTGMVVDNDAYVVTYSVPTTGNDFTVRVSKKDGNITQVMPQKKP
jgi:membrane-bound ClpP family serine protease